MSKLKKSFFLLAAFVMVFTLAAAAFQPAQAAEVANCKTWYTVNGGDSLIKIAQKFETNWRTIAEINDLEEPYVIRSGQKLCIETTGTTTGTIVTTPTPTPAPGTGGSAAPSNRVYASSVQEDKSVTLQGRNLAKNTRYSVTLSKYGSTTNVNSMGSVLTNAAGAFTVTYALPKKLVDVAKISATVRSSGDSATNWFINATSSGNTGGVSSPAFTFSVVSSREDQSVTIKTANMPANVVFDALMGKAGTKAEKGIVVGSVFDGDGTVRVTFTIPADLQGRSKLDIRLENKNLGVFYYLTIENKDLG
jgi:hypothetical protein